MITASHPIGVFGNTVGKGGTSTGTHLHFTLQHNGVKVDPFGWVPGEVLIDPNTQLITDTKSGAVIYEGETSACLWSTGCANNQWVNPNQGATITTTDKSASLQVPANTTPGIAHFSVGSAWDNVAGSTSVPAGYSYRIRAWDRDGLSLTSFSNPLLLTVNYDDAVTNYVQENSLQFYWWDTALESWVAMPTTLDTNTNTAQVLLSHLSWFSLKGTPVNPAPQLDNVSPDLISTEKQVEITISGAHFDPDMDVWLGRARLPFEFVNENTVLVTVPAWEPNGVYSIEVVNPDYQSDELDDAVEIATPKYIFLPIITR